MTFLPSLICYLNVASPVHRGKDTVAGERKGNSCARWPRITLWCLRFFHCFFLISELQKAQTKGGKIHSAKHIMHAQSKVLTYASHHIIQVTRPGRPNLGPKEFVSVKQQLTNSLFLSYKLFTYSRMLASCSTRNSLGVNLQRKELNNVPRKYCVLLCRFFHCKGKASS